MGSGQRLGIDCTTIKVHSKGSRGQLITIRRSAGPMYLHAEQEYPASRAKARQANVEPPVAPKNAMVLAIALERDHKDDI